MKLNDATRRALRTIYQFIIACVGIIPVVTELLPKDSPLVAQLAIVLGFLVAAVKVINELEDRGIIPAWLKAPASDGQDPVPDPNNQPAPPPAA